MKPDITGISAGAAVEKYFEGADPRGLSDRTDDRIWGHDFIHTMLGTNLASGRSEEITAIYQAVLLRDGTCQTIKKPWCDGGDTPSLVQIKGEVIPRIRAFVTRFLQQFGLKPNGNTALTETEIEFHYKRAIRVGEMMHSEFGRYLGEIPVSEIKEMVIDRFTEVFRRVDGLSTALTEKAMLSGLGFR